MSQQPCYEYKDTPEFTINTLLDSGKYPLMYHYQVDGKPYTCADIAIRRWDTMQRKERERLYGKRIDS